MAARKLQGQVAIVTGAGRGIGEATAQRLARAGAAVVLAARDEGQLEHATGQILRNGGRAIGVVADVSDGEQVEEMVESALDQFGRVDILVNNAAVIWPLDEVRDVDPDEWAYAIHVNLVGPFYAIHNVLPLMIEQGYGRIVNVSCHASDRPERGLSAYCAAKAGLNIFGDVLARELEGCGVSVNTLLPGPTDTELQADLRSVDTSESGLDFALAQRQFDSGALRPVADVAAAIYWLVGPWSRARHGEIFDLADQEFAGKVLHDTQQ